MPSAKPHPLDAVIQALSGVEHDASRAMHINGLCARLHKLPGCKGITPKAVEKWFERRGLPNSWRVSLAWLAEHDGIVIAIPEPMVIKREHANANPQAT